MYKKLKDIPSEQYGIGLGLLGFFVMVIGAIASFTYFPNVGFYISAFGIFLGFFGALIHFIINWREIFSGHS